MYCHDNQHVHPQQSIHSICWKEMFGQWRAPGKYQIQAREWFLSSNNESIQSRENSTFQPYVVFFVIVVNPWIIVGLYSKKMNEVFTV